MLVLEVNVAAPGMQLAKKLLEIEFALFPLAIVTVFLNCLLSPLMSRKSKKVLFFQRANLKTDPLVSVREPLYNTQCI